MAKQTYTAQDNMTLRGAQFDECVAELSPEAQQFFLDAVGTIAAEMANGGGEKSAKELLFQIAKTKKESKS